MTNELNLTVEVKADRGEKYAFTPDSLIVRVINMDFSNGVCIVYYKLWNSNLSVNPEIYITRSWFEEGNMKIPLSVISNIKNEDGFNIELINSVLDMYGLQVKPETTIPENPDNLISGGTQSGGTQSGGTQSGGTQSGDPIS